MKLYCLVIVWLVTASAFAQTSETRKLSSFKNVQTAGAINVYLKKGSIESVKVEAEGIDRDDVVTEVSGGYLRVHLRDLNYHGQFNVKVYVTYVNLERISASASSKIFSEGMIKADMLNIVASSSASVELTAEAGDMAVDVGSSGHVTLEGKANSISIKASSGGSVEAGNLECEKVDATASSGGSATITVGKSLNANASSGGSIRYRGNPTSSNTDSSSGGVIEKSN